MAMVVKNNMGAVRTLNTLNKNSSALQKSLAKVSSGMKINSAQDDASGYAISEKMRVQIRSLDQANQNTQNASSLMKTAEGAVSSTMEILKSLKEKAVNAATDTNTDQDRATIQKELDQFIDQIDDNALTTFNGKYLVDGSKSQAGSDTYTAMTNQSLGLTDTDGNTVAGGTELTKLTNRNGESLEINSTDYVTASFVKNGETYTTKYQVGTTKLEDIFKNLNNIGGSSTGESPAVTAARQAVATAQSNLTAAAKAVNDIADNVINAISNLPAVKSNTAAGDSWNNPTAYAADFTTAKNAVVNWVDTFRVDGTNKGTASGNNFKVSTGFTSQVYNTLSGTSKKIVHDNTAAWSWKLGGTNGTSAIDNNTSGYGAALDTYNSAVDALAQAQADLRAALGGGGGGGGGASSGTVNAFGPAKVGTPGNSLVYVGTDVGLAASCDMVGTTNGESGVTVTAASGGIYGQISGLTISITDSEGNVKKSANAALDDFRTTVYAKNKSDNNELTFQVGAKANQSITVGLDDMRAEALGLKGNSGTKVSVATQANANAAIAVFDNAIQKVLDQQATIGAIEARLEYTSQNLTTSSENVQAAESTIRDADMAKEMTEYTKNNVLLQASQSMLAQANQNSSAVLSLLQ